METCNVKTLITNILTAAFTALSAFGIKIPGVDSQTMTEVVGAIATLVVVGNQVVHYLRDKAANEPMSLRMRGFARLEALLMLVILAAAAFVLTACAGITPNGNMSPEQLAAAAKDKSASVACGTGTGPWGKVNTVYVNVDKASVTNGIVTVDAECKVSVSTAQKPAP
jgi:cytochrome c biogenesis factor